MAASDPVCLADFENYAREHLPKHAFDFFAGGANEENTLRENVEAFKRWEGKSLLATSLPVAQWLERPTGVRKVMGSILIGDSGFFFVPRSRHVEYSIFSYSFSELKFTIFLYLSICPLFMLHQ